MEEIEVGEYVRTKRGIGKILEVKTVKTKMYGKHDLAYLIDTCPKMYITDTQFIKHSKNIIDLIEVGDYVNGKLVSNVDKVDNMNFIEWDDGDMYKTEIQNDKFIKSIVTREQFSSMEYKIQN